MTVGHELMQGVGVMKWEDFVYRFGILIAFLFLSITLVLIRWIIINH